MLILPIHEHGKSFHFVKSSISFFNDLKFLSYRSFTCLVRVTPRYFILCVTIIMNIVSLISTLFHLSFILRKATDGVYLILHPVTLLKEFISCSNSLVEFLWSFMYTIVSTANSESLNSSFSICVPLISFCCLIALAITSSTILNKYVDCGQPCLVPDFNGIFLSLSPFNLMFSNGLLYVAFYYV